MADQSDENKKVHEEAMKRWEVAFSAEHDQREKAIEDALFANVGGAQFDDAVARDFDDAGCPKIEINLINAAKETIIGEQRKTEIALKYRAASGGATPELAKTLTGLVRNIDVTNNGRAIYDNAFDEILDGGYGAWRYNTEFSPDGFNQDIIIESILDAATTVWGDPQGRKLDGSDDKYKFVREQMTREAYKDRWPDSAMSDFPDESFNQNICEGWFKEEQVIVAEYWRKVAVKEERALLSDGRVISVDEDGGALEGLEERGITVVKQKKVDTFKVEQFIVNGSEVLEGPKAWAGTFIPIVQIYGKTRRIQGKNYRHGIVRFAKDPSRMNNYATSSILYKSAIQPPDVPWISKQQIVGVESEVQSMNLGGRPVNVYNHVDGIPMPRRDAPAPIPAALVQIQQQAQQSIGATLGVSAANTDPAINTAADRRSGEAIIAQQMKGDAGTFVYFDQIIKGLEYGGRILADLLPRIYDAQRQVRILNPDGSEEFVTINETVPNPEGGDPIIVNDLSLGRYDVATDTGPAFATQRMAAVESLMGLAESNELFAQLTSDLLAKNLDVPNSDEIHKRIRDAMIKAGTVQPTEEELAEIQKTQPQEPSFAEQIAQREAVARVAVLEGEAARLMAGAKKTEADAILSLAKIENTDADTLKKTSEAEGQNLENIDAAADLGLPLTEQDHDKRISMSDAVESAQQAIVPGPTSEQMIADGLTQGGG